MLTRHVKAYSSSGSVV